MSDIIIKDGDSVVAQVALPRDLSNVSAVDIHIGRDNTETVNLSIEDAASGRVGIPLAAVTKGPGRYRIEFELLFSDGSVETLPASGFDALRIVDDLA
jgi:hypothetical protein